MCADGHAGGRGGGVRYGIICGDDWAGANGHKKVLAYSTVSQLGYMFLACGVGAFSAGIFT
jgi:hypothetical protein